MKSLNEMEKFVRYIEEYSYDFSNQTTIVYSFRAVNDAFIDFKNGYSVFIHKQEYKYHGSLEFIIVSVYDWDGNIVCDELYGICEENQIPCKNEEELIGILETIRNLPYWYTGNNQ